MSGIGGVAIRTNLKQDDLEEIILDLDMSCKERFGGGFGVIKSQRAENLFEFSELDCAPFRTFMVFVVGDSVYIKNKGVLMFVWSGLEKSGVEIKIDNDSEFPEHVKSFIREELNAWKSV